jgi:hypothetical protein
MTSERIVRGVASIAVAATLALSAATAGVAQTTGPYQPAKSGLKKCIKRAKKKHKGDPAARKKAVKKCKKKFR